MTAPPVYSSPYVTSAPQTLTTFNPYNNYQQLTQSPTNVGSSSYPSYGSYPYYYQNYPNYESYPNYGNYPSYGNYPNYGSYPNYTYPSYDYYNYPSNYPDTPTDYNYNYYDYYQNVPTIPPTIKTTTTRRTTTRKTTTRRPYTNPPTTRKTTTRRPYTNPPKPRPTQPRQPRPTGDPQQNSGKHNYNVVVNGKERARGTDHGTHDISLNGGRSNNFNVNKRGSDEIRVGGTRVVQNGNAEVKIKYNK
jgi:hypothetical protein